MNDLNLATPSVHIEHDSSQNPEETFTMDGREYKMLKTTSKTVEWGGLTTKILSLPTLEAWNIFVTMSAVVVYILGFYCIFFKKDNLFNYIPFYLACDIIYMVDVNLNLLHKYWKKLRQKFQLEPKKNHKFVVDIISLLPQELIIGGIFGFQHSLTVYCRMLTFIRLCRITHLFGDMLGSARTRRWIWFLTQYIVVFTMALHTAACTLYFIANTDVLREGKVFWKALLPSSNTSVSSMYVTCLYVAVTLISNTGFGDFYAQNIMESVYSICIMSCGYLFVAAFIAMLTVKLVNIGYTKSKFAFGLENIRVVLEQINAPKKLKRQVLAYYKVLLVNKNGVNNAPELYTLPTSLRMELMYDINVVHLQNSLLFKNQPEPLLRKISLLIKHVFLLPGDIFYHQGGVKRKMVFVASGILEILSDEDDDSPIISFRAGTVLGEVALFITVPARATVRAATYTELQVIERQDFMRMMLDHPHTVLKLRRVIFERLENAGNERLSFDKDHVIMNLLVSNVKEFRPIKLLKDHLMQRNVQESSLTKFRSISAEVGGVPKDKSNFDTSCLGLYKLCANVTMIERPHICATSDFPWILYPNSSLIYYWNNIVNISQVILCLILPFYIIYVRKFTPTITLYSYVEDGIYLVDIFVRCTTAVELRNRTIKKFTEIVNYRMREIVFYVDVFSLFPIEVIAFTIQVEVDVQHRLFSLLKLNRMLRIWRMSRIFSSLHQDMTKNLLATTILKYACYFLLANFWAGTILYLESCMYPVCTKGNWFEEQMTQSRLLKASLPCYQYPVALSTYFGSMVIFLVGYGDVLPNSQTDIVFVCVLVLLGMFLIAYCTAQLCAMFSLRDYFRKEFQGNLVAFRKYILKQNPIRIYLLVFNRFLKQNNLEHSLSTRVIKFFRLQWDYDQGTGRDFFLNSASKEIRSALQSAELRSALRKTPLFDMVDVDFLSTIAEGARVQVLPSNEVIAYMGDFSREMYIILNGHCEVLSDIGEVAKTYGPGAEFGSLEMIYGIPKRYTTRTVTNCKIISVDYRTYVQAISVFPIIMEEIKNVIEEQSLLNWVRFVDNERTRFKSYKKETCKKNIRQKLFHWFFSTSFIYTYGQCKRTRGMEKYWQPFKTMGKFQFLGWFLLPIAIHPNGLFIWMWCIIRVISIMIVCFLGPFYIAVTPFADSLTWILTATNCCAALDIYILMHVGYYNKKGLLVTHPKKTAQHYLSHSFLIDIVAIFPFSTITYWKNLTHKEGHSSVTNLLTSHISQYTWNLNGVLQFHRINELFYYKERDISKSLNFIRFFKLVPFCLVLINLLTSFIFDANCEYEFFATPQNDTSSEVIVTHSEVNLTYYGYLRCPNGTWLKESQFRQLTNPLEVYVVGFYWVTGTLLGVGIGDITVHKQNSMYIVIFTILLGRLLFAYVFANLATAKTPFSTVMSNYQENLKGMMKFLNRESVDYHSQRKIFHYFEYVWNRTSGFESKQLCKKLNTALMEDTVVFMYERTLREVPLFENVEKSFIRVIAKHLSQEYFLKGDTVIRCLDVQNNIYIIYRGKVDVLSSCHEMIACMGCGGLFGNIRQVSPGCSSIAIVASRNLDVLVISSEAFYKVIKDYPRIQRNMGTLLETVTDYIMPTTIIDEGSVEVSADNFSAASRGSNKTFESSVESGSQGASEVFGGDHHKHKALRTAINFFLPYKWFKFAILPDHIIIKIISFTILVVSYWDIWAILYFFVTQSDNVTLLYINLVMESVFYFKVFVHLHVAYMDRQGNYITRFRKIARHYLLDQNRVFWDVVPNLPVELLCFFAAPQNRLTTLRALRLIHLLRFEYLFHYFTVVNKQLMTNFAFTQILRMALFMSISVHVFACTWLMIACPFNKCWENSWVNEFKFSDRTPLYLYIVSVYYVISLVTTTGIVDIYPTNIVEVSFTTVVMIITRFLTALALSDMVSVIIVSSRSLVQYKNRVYRLHVFLRNQNVSTHQMEKLWGYVRNLWGQEKGQHLPIMLKDTPYVLRCDIMNIMFGQHLRNSFLFQGLNEALLRQLAVRLNRVVFFKGNYIVQDGDIDQNMYFVQSGEVSVLTVHPNLTETQHQRLNLHDMFGVAQGLYHGVPHQFSYRANTVVSILVLNFDSWNHMLKYFPVDKEIIYSRAQTIYVKL